MEAMEITCKDCGKVFHVSGRGRRPSKCHECRNKQKAQKVSQKIKTPKEPRKFICESCHNEIIHTNRGKLPKICNSCKANKVKPQTKTRTFVCKTCNTKHNAPSRGKLPTICKTCKENSKATKEPKQKKQKEPRKFVCKFCNETYETSNRGKLPTVCKCCKESNAEHKAYVKKSKEVKPQTRASKIRFEIVEKGTENRLSQSIFSSFARASDFAVYCSKGKEFEVRQVGA